MISIQTYNCGRRGCVININPNHIMYAQQNNVLGEQHLIKLSLVNNEEIIIDEESYRKLSIKV